MKRSVPLLIVFSVLFETGCMTLKVGTDNGSPPLEVSGLADGYVSLNGIRPYDETIVQASILNWSSRPGELASLDVWPLAGLGVGLVGARFQLLFLDVGLGALIYRPKTPSWKDTEEPEKKEHQPTPETQTEGAKKDTTGPEPPDAKEAQPDPKSPADTATEEG